jgi:serine/threonine-protein kinase
MTIISNIPFVLTFAGALLAPTAVLAASPTEQAAAVALFQEAKKLVAAGDFEHACPKFAEAQKLLPTPGTALSLGDCYEKGGKLASAWGAFKQAEFFARSTGASEHQAEAQRRAEALTPKLAHLAIVVPPTAKVAGFEVRRDGDVVGEAQWGSPVPADTGWHKIEASAPGRKAWSTTVRIESDGSSASVTVPELEAGPAAGDTSFWGRQRIAGAAVSGVGAFGLVLGAIFGGVTLAKTASSNGHCQKGAVTTCDSTGLQIRSDAKGWANASNAAFAVGGAAVIAGGVVLLTAPGARQTDTAARTQVRLNPLVGAAQTGLMIEGAW